MAYTYNQALDTLPQRYITFRYQPSGSGIIEGITQIDGVASPCRVTLYTQDGTRMDYTRTGDDGLYTFYSLPPGDYQIVIQDDMQNDKQPHIVLVNIA